MRQTLTTFGGELVHEISDPAVIAMFRLAIAEAVYAPEIAQALSDIGASRDALREMMQRAISAGLATGEPDEMAR